MKTTAVNPIIQDKHLGISLHSSFSGHGFIQLTDLDFTPVIYQRLLILSVSLSTSQDTIPAHSEHTAPLNFLTCELQSAIQIISKHKTDRSQSSTYNHSRLPCCSLGQLQMPGNAGISVTRLLMDILSSQLHKPAYNCSNWAGMYLASPHILPSNRASILMYYKNSSLEDPLGS